LELQATGGAGMPFPVAVPVDDVKIIKITFKTNASYKVQTVIRQHVK